jgi:hypothetical protein
MDRPFGLLLRSEPRTRARCNVKPALRRFSFAVKPTSRDGNGAVYRCAPKRSREIRIFTLLTPGPPRDAPECVADSSVNSIPVRAGLPKA